MDPRPACLYPYPQVFVLDREGMQQPSRNGASVPWCSFPVPSPRHKRKSHNCVLSVVLLILFLVLCALGLAAYQILNLKKSLKELRQNVNMQTESPVVQKLIGEMNMDIKKKTQAAHLTVVIEKYPEPAMLLWESIHGIAFTNGVSYEKGGLQVNETGLYYVYSRLEFTSKTCLKLPMMSLRHTVFKRTQDPKPLTLLEGHREGYCQPGQTEKVWLTSNYLGGVIQLRKNDCIFVSTSHPNLLSHDHNSNVFGLFRI